MIEMYRAVVFACYMQINAALPLWAIPPSCDYYFDEWGPYTTLEKCQDRVVVMYGVLYKTFIDQGFRPISISGSCVLDKEQGI